MTRQCQHVGAKGQCESRPVDGEIYCEKHCKAHRVDPDAKDKKLYILLNHRRRIRHAELTEHSALRGLHEEIAIAKQLLEDRLNSLKTDADSIVAASSLNSHLLTIEKLISACFKIEKSMGELLSKPLLITLANDLVKIILEELDGIKDYERIVDKISQRVVDAVSKIGVKE